MKRIKYQLIEKSGLLESKAVVSNSGRFFRISIYPDTSVKIFDLRTGNVETHFTNTSLAVAKVRAKEVLATMLDVRFEMETRARFPAPELLKGKSK